MGFLRGGIITILTILLLITLFAGNILWTFSGSLEYNHLKPSLIKVSTEVIQESQILAQLEQNKIYLQMYCTQNENIHFNESGLELDIPCVIALADTNTIVEYGVTQLIDQLYYKQYDCDFWTCVQEQNPPLVILSEKSYQYWRALFYWSLIASILFFLLMFLIAKNKSTPFIISGILMIITAIPFKNLEWIFSLLPLGAVAKFLAMFFSKSYSVFLTMLILGIIFLAIGLVLRFTGLGKKISWNYKKDEEEKENQRENTKKDPLSKQEVKKIIKEEINKSKQTRIKKK